MKNIFATALFLFAFFCTNAKVTLPKLFGDNMVLQRNKSIRIWGNASSGEQILVAFHQQFKTTKADISGKWQ